MYLLQDALGEKPMPKPVDLLQGTLDMLILKAVSLGPLHGYGVLLRIQQISSGRLEIQQGSCTRRSFGSSIRGSSPASGVNRRTSAGPRYYSLTPAGRRRFQEQTRDWNRMADIIAGVLRTAPEEL